MVVIAILLTSAVAGVWLVKKYVCGGRSVKLSAFHITTHTNEQHASSSVSLTHAWLSVIRFLVHRYSVMREHVEGNKIEGVDDIDPHYMETGKAQYNEDSDQVCDAGSKALYLHPVTTY